MQKQVSGMLIFCKVPWSARVDVASQAWDGWLAMALDGHCISLHDWYDWNLELLGMVGGCWRSFMIGTYWN